MDDMGKLLGLLWQNFLLEVTYVLHHDWWAMCMRGAGFKEKPWAPRPVCLRLFPPLKFRFRFHLDEDATHGTHVPFINPAVIKVTRKLTEEQASTRISIRAKSALRT